MRLSEEAIRDRMHAIRRDDRYKAPPADMQINAPLAIVQSGLNTELRTLYFVMNYDEEFVAGETAAETMIARYGTLEASTTLRPRLGSFSASYILGYMAVVHDHERAESK